MPFQVFIYFFIFKKILYIDIRYIYILNFKSKSYTLHPKLNINLHNPKNKLVTLPISVASGASPKQNSTFNKKSPSTTSINLFGLKKSNNCVDFFWGVRIRMIMCDT